MASDSEPGAFLGVAGVHRLPLPLPMDGLRAVNVYVIETDDGLVLVDGGWAIPESRKVFDAGSLRVTRSATSAASWSRTCTLRPPPSERGGPRGRRPRLLGLGDKATMDLMSATRSTRTPMPSCRSSPAPWRCTTRGAR